MSSETCPDCGNLVAVQDEYCPRCGRPADKSVGAADAGGGSADGRPNRLYKLAQVLGVLLFCGSVASCSTILFNATKDMNHVLGMNLALFGMILGILLTFCPRAFSTR